MDVEPRDEHAGGSGLTLRRGIGTSSARSGARGQFPVAKEPPHPALRRGALSTGRRPRRRARGMARHSVSTTAAAAGWNPPKSRCVKPAWLAGRPPRTDRSAKKEDRASRGRGRARRRRRLLPWRWSPPAERPGHAEAPVAARPRCDRSLRSPRRAFRQRRRRRGAADCMKTCGRSPRDSRCARERAAALHPRSLRRAARPCRSGARSPPRSPPTPVARAVPRPTGASLPASGHRRRCRRRSGRDPSPSTSRTARSSVIRTTVRKLRSQAAGGPSGVVSQSRARMSAAISPAPENRGSTPDSPTMLFGLLMPRSPTADPRVEGPASVRRTSVR